MKQKILLSAEKIKHKIGGEDLFLNQTFNIRAGNIYKIQGSNGCGKTTLLNIISGFINPTSGKIKVYGNDISKTKTEKIQLIGCGISRSFQDAKLVDNFTILDQLLFASECYGTTINNIFLKKSTLLFQVKNNLARIIKLIQPFKSLLDKKDLYVWQLSVGERRLLSVLSALIAKTQIVLLDEPFANMSDNNTNKLKDLIKNQCVSENRAIVIVQHGINNDEDFFDVVINLSNRDDDRNSPELNNKNANVKHSSYNVLNIENLSIGYDNKLVLEECNLKLDIGKIIGIIGSNGSGKSTLFRAITGLIKPDKGIVEILGNDISKYSTDEIIRRNKVGYLLQSNRNFSNLLVDENLCLSQYNNGNWKSIVDNKDELLIKPFFQPLFKKKNSFANSLSRGENLLLNIAALLLQNPDLILLDEPSAQLDSANCKFLSEIIYNYKNNNKSVIIIEQSLEFLKPLVDEIHEIKTFARRNISNEGKFFNTIVKK